VLKLSLFFFFLPPTDGSMRREPIGAPGAHLQKQLTRSLDGQVVRDVGTVPRVPLNSPTQLKARTVRYRTYRSRSAADSVRKEVR